MLGKVSASMIFNFWTGMRMSRCILSCRYVAEKDCLALLQAPPVRLNADGNCAFSETRRAAKLLQQFGGFPFPAAEFERPHIVVLSAPLAHSPAVIEPVESWRDFFWERDLRRRDAVRGCAND